MDGIHRASRDTWNLPVGPDSAALLIAALRFRSAALHTLRSTIANWETGFAQRPTQESWICFGYGSRADEIVYALRACAFTNPATLAAAPNFSLTSDRSRFATYPSALPLRPQSQGWLLHAAVRSQKSASHANPLVNRE